MRTPALFIGHGSPMNLVEDNAFTKAMESLGASLPRPKAIVVVSAHWMTRGTFATAMERPRTIHDFYGFPKELYKLDYPAPGDPELAAKLADSLSGFGAACDLSWGLDHGAWAVLKRLFPDASVPVVQLSVDYRPGARENVPMARHRDIGRSLRGLRDEGVLLIGSGNIVHNLQIVDFEDEDAKPYPWAIDFDAKVAKLLEDGNDEALLRPETLEGFELAAPTWDHYIPLACALGWKEDGEKAVFPFEGFQNASISMRAVRFG